MRIETRGYLSSTPLAGGSVGGFGPGRQTSPAGGDVLTGAMRGGLATLQQAQASRKASPSARDAMDRMAMLMQSLLLGAQGVLTTAASQGMAEDAKSSNDRIKSAEGKIKGHYDQAQAHTQKKIEAIQKRIKAQKSSGFFSKLMSVFKVIGSALGVAAAVLSGGTLGLVTAGIIAASLAASAIGGETMKWVSIGLSIAALGAGTINLVAGASQAVHTGVRAALQTLCKVGEALTRAGELGAGIGVTLADGRRLEAEAQVQQQGAEAAKERRDADQSTDALSDLRETMNRGFDQLLALVGADHDAQLAALRPAVGGTR